MPVVSWTIGNDDVRDHGPRFSVLKLGNPAVLEVQIDRLTETVTFEDTGSGEVSFRDAVALARWILAELGVVLP